GDKAEGHIRVRSIRLRGSGVIGTPLGGARVDGRASWLDLDLCLLQDMDGRLRQRDLDDDAPQRPDRSPRATRVDELRCPRPGSYHDLRAGEPLTVVQLDAGYASRIEPRPGGLS